MKLSAGCLHSQATSLALRRFLGRAVILLTGFILGDEMVAVELNLHRDGAERFRPGQVCCGGSWISIHRASLIPIASGVHHIRPGDDPCQPHYGHENDVPSLEK